VCSLRDGRLAEHSSATLSDAVAAYDEQDFSGAITSSVEYTLKPSRSPSRKA
jgi:hypothetical protein